MRMRGIHAAALAALLATAMVALSAHPTADTFVVITVDDNGRVMVSLTGDRRALALKAEALGGSLSGHVEVRLDGEEVPLVAVAMREVPGRAGFASLELAGSATASSRHLSFRTTAIAGAYPLLVRHADEPRTAEDARYDWVSVGAWSRTYDLEALGAATHSTFGDAVTLGFTHIVPKGLDHILFVLGLFLLSARLGVILAQVTAFTVAHSVTLALGALGVVTAPAAIVEPLIALSIVYVGVENLRSTTLHRTRLGVVFVFGLLHGLGFAEAVSSLTLSPGGWLATLAGFNIGVELGQFAVVAAAAAAAATCARLAPERYRAWVVRPASVSIAAAGAMWVIERVL